MDSIRWSSLPRDILTTIARRFNTDVDLLRFRAVCTAWRSAVLPRRRFSFPVKVPFPNACFDDLNPNSRPGYFALFQSTLYRLSPISDAHSPNGWLFKVIATNKPNTFSLLNPLSSYKIKFVPECFPNRINLLDYRISEICKSYSLKFVDLEDPSEQSEFVRIRRVAVLSNYLTDDNFVVMLLLYGGSLEAWRCGEEKWTKIGGDDYQFDDVLCCEGKCYAVTFTGVVMVFDSELKPIDSIMNTFLCYNPRQQKLLLEFDGDLYLVDKTSDPDPEFDYDYYLDGYVVNENTINMPMKLSFYRMNKVDGDWNYVGRLGGRVFFLGDDVSFGIWEKDFDGCKGNCVYLTDECFVQIEEDGVCGVDTGVYDLNDCKIVALAECLDYAKVFWPAPSWLTASTSSLQC
ncbi:hypothetical protein Nepgr_008432 [Nepenthes gracilis]|uniref:F-box domain-containing protein n=1 Tax=Nepenthes gracilis TaxID=150966 RepID=A0AAD3S8W6_NEPGR|nr:hypothetical protein Nepgr_008432 [Nepenthes gracilis]